MLANPLERPIALLAPLIAALLVASCQTPYEKQKKAIMSRAVVLLDQGKCDSASACLRAQHDLMERYEVRSDDEYDMAKLALGLRYEDGKCGPRDVHASTSLTPEDRLDTLRASYDAARRGATDVFHSIIAGIRTPDSAARAHNLDSLDKRNGFGPFRWKMTPSEFANLAKEHLCVDFDYHLAVIWDTSCTPAFLYEKQHGDCPAISHTRRAYTQTIESVKGQFAQRFIHWQAPVFGTKKGADIDVRSRGELRCSETPTIPSVSFVPVKELMCFVLHDPFRVDGVEYVAEAWFDRPTGGLFAIVFRTLEVDTFTETLDQRVRNYYRQREFSPRDAGLLEADYRWDELSTHDEQNSLDGVARFLSSVLGKYGLGSPYIQAASNDRRESAWHAYSLVHKGANTELTYAVRWRLSTDSPQRIVLGAAICLRAASCSVASCLAELSPACKNGSWFESDSLTIVKGTGDRKHGQDSLARARSARHAVDAARKNQRLGF